MHIREHATHTYTNRFDSGKNFHIFHAQREQERNVLIRFRQKNRHPNRLQTEQQNKAPRRSKNGARELQELLIQRAKETTAD